MRKASLQSREQISVECAQGGELRRFIVIKFVQFLLLAWVVDSVSHDFFLFALRSVLRLQASVFRHWPHGAKCSDLTRWPQYLQRTARLRSVMPPAVAMAL